MRRSLPPFILLILLLQLLPSVEAAWATSHTFPPAFRPNRTVDALYSIQSTSAADLPIRWVVALSTCQDTTGDGTCTSSDQDNVFHGARTFDLLGGQSANHVFPVFLNRPEGTYTYTFRAVCADNPCTRQPPAPEDSKHGTFQLRYTNTWTRTVSTPTPISVGAQQTVTYTLRSTSPDDRDLSGTAELWTKPNGASETSQGTRTYNVQANQQTSPTWANVPFPTIGPQQLRVRDTSFPLDAYANATVLGVHLHVTQPRPNYGESGRFSLYIQLEGHGATPDPQAILNSVQVSFRNGTFPLATTTLTTSTAGQAYLTFQGADDLPHVNWTATTSGTWNGITYNLETKGTANYTTAPGIGDQDLKAIRADLDIIRLEGVHLDELGSRNLFLLVVRAAGGVLVFFGLVLLVFLVATRV